MKAKQYWEDCKNWLEYINFFDLLKPNQNTNLSKQYLWLRIHLYVVKNVLYQMKIALLWDKSYILLAVTQCSRRWARMKNDCLPPWWFFSFRDLLNDYFAINPSGLSTNDHSQKHKSGSYVVRFNNVKYF